MADMTMGQRIAVRRKLKNLSQEALAAQLDVSRQAISKWESDAAIPEVDKLIALGKLFGVSVGWLLGTEREAGTTAQQESGLTESQLREVEEIVARNRTACQPVHRRWPWLLLAAAVLAPALILSLSHISNLEKRNLENLAAVEQLRRENETLRDQVGTVQEKLNAMAEAERLLKGMYGQTMILDYQTVWVRFVLTPKVYQEGADAYLSVKKPGYNAEYIPCTWNGEQYILETELARMDGYQYSFLLVTEDSFREQSLMDPDFYYDIARLSDIGTHCYFHLNPESEQFDFMYYTRQHRWLDPQLKEYVFQEDLYGPRIFSETGQGYKEIRLTLQLNNEILWDQSLLEDFLRHTGGHHISSEPFPLNLSVTLPELKLGDNIQLWLNVTMEDDQWYCVRLDEMYCWERPE